jgi:NAD(P)H-hydrate epimerase
MNPPALTREQSRVIDRLATDKLGIPGLVLMENAGRGVVDVLLRTDPSLIQEHSLADRHNSGKVTILCGKGNNAGDGFVIARHLEIRGIPVRVLLLASPEELGGDARVNFEILAHTDVPLVDLSSCEDLATALDRQSGDSTWLVDALLGTGARGAPREPLRTAIEWMDGKAAKRLAVDLPSGLDCDTGQPANPTLRADITCTMVAPKIGFRAATAKPLLGQVHVVSIGIPPKWVQINVQ